MKRYPKYKDSGVPWLGQVPAHWEVKALKHISAVDSCGSYGLDEFQSDINMPVATTAQISKEGLFNVDDMPIRSFTRRELARFGCMTGDILVVKSSGSASNIISGKAGLVEETTPNFVFSNFLLRLRLNKESACPYFVFSLLRSHLTRQRVELMCSTTTYPNLKIGEYISAWLPMPPLVEQEAIGLYLRRALGEIDAAILSQEQMIELLKERRSAIITQAVTKGLDPNAKMKDSGVPWLGQVPEHWQLKRAKFLLRKMSRNVLDGDEVVTAFRDGTVTRRSNKREDGFTFSDKEIGYQGVEPGDFVLHSMDAAAGAVGISDSRGKCSPVCAICEPYAGINASYLVEVFRVMARTGWIAAHAKGIRQRSTDFRFDDMGRLFFPVPPLDEANAVCSFIDNVSRDIDSAISSQERMIELLKERRSAIITQAVTGQIDVR